MKRLVPVLLAATVLGACEDVTSEDILTSGIYADLSVEASDHGTSTVRAVLKVGGASSNTYVQLTGEDELVATVGDESQPMVEQTLGDYHEYVAGFATANGGDVFKVSLNRSIDEGAPNSTMTLPDPFDIDPVTGPLQRSSDITITWSPANSTDNMRITAAGSCVLTYERDISGDPGTVTIEAGSLIPLDDAAQESCEVTYQIDRWRAGTLDPGYGEGGKAIAHQIRTISVLTQP